MEGFEVQWLMGLTAFILSTGGVCGAIMHIIRLRAHNRAQIEKEHDVMTRISRLEEDMKYLKESHRTAKSGTEKLFENVTDKLVKISDTLTEIKLDSVKAHNELSERLIALEKSGCSPTRPAS